MRHGSAGQAIAGLWSAAALMGACGGVVEGNRSGNGSPAGGTNPLPYAGGGVTFTGGVPATSTGGTSSTPAGGTTSSGGLAGGGGREGNVGTDGGSYLPCLNPVPLLGPNGAPTGYVYCEGGSIHRETKMDCPTSIPRTTACVQPAGSTSPPECTYDSECAASPNGYCGGSYGCYCVYGCLHDSDCAAGEICLCGDPVGQCSPSTCTSDQDCGQGMCLSYTLLPSCTHRPFFACQKPGDNCVSDADCQYGWCSLVNDRHVCDSTDCAK